MDLYDKNTLTWNDLFTLDNQSLIYETVSNISSG